jgi:hypothetical protein
MEDNMPPWWPMSGIDLIPDEETALKIGRIILERYYGESTFARFEPYRASLRGEEWGVAGTPSFPPGVEPAHVRGGGHPALRISKKDGRVIHIALTR